MPTAIAAGALALLCAGCGEDNRPASSNRGAGSESFPTTVENAFIVPRSVPGSCAIQTGDPAHLRFTVTNNDMVEREDLLAVTTDAAQTVRMNPAGGFEIDPGGRLAVGEPIATPDAAGRQVPTVVLDGLDRDVRAGMSVDVTFDFQRAGDITMRVPIDACPPPE